MSERTARLLRVTLILGGAGLGLIAWVLTGLGCVELEFIAAFDPFGMDMDAPPKTAATNVLEWSFPAFALVGALVFPRLALWLVKPSAFSEST